MPYRRSRLNVVHSEKHEVTWSILAQDFAGSPFTTNLAIAVLPLNKNLSVEVATGSKVFGIYIEMNMSNEAITNTNIVHWKIVYEPSTATSTAANTYYQTDRAKILKRGMEMLPKSVGTVFKRIVFVRIPRQYQRMKEGDNIRIMLKASAAQTANFCGFAIYKEFS